jgi:hypothetical protein
MQIFKLENILIITVIFITILLSSLGMYNEVNLLYIAVCTVLLIMNRRLLLLIYIIYLPTNGFISTEYNLFGILHVSYIIHIFALTAALFEWDYIDSETKIEIRQKFRINKIAFYFALFVFLYLLLSEYRLYFLGLSEISINKLVNRTIKHSMMFLPLLILIRLSCIDTYYRIILKGYLVSLTIIALSIIFSGYLHQLGVTTQDADRLIGSGFQDSYVRRAGVFIGFGDVNSAAGFLAIGFAFVLFSEKYLLSNSIKSFLLVLFTIALIAAGSRASFLGLFSIIVLFIISTNISVSYKVIYSIFISTLILLLYTQGYFIPILDRFSELSAGEGHFDIQHQFGRIGGWIFYLDYIFSDIYVFLGGTTTSIYEGMMVPYERAAHNFFIQLLYRWGIFPLLYILILIVRYIQYSTQPHLKVIYIAILIPFIVTLIFVSDTAVFLGFTTALVALPYGR